MTDQYRLGVDVGGTFTDAILVNESTGETRTGKVSSTPSDPSHVTRWSRTVPCASVPP